MKGFSIVEVNERNIGYILEKIYSIDRLTGEDCKNSHGAQTCRFSHFELLIFSSIFTPSSNDGDISYSMQYVGSVHKQQNNLIYN